MSLLFRLASAAFVLAVPNMANAAWHEASSKHFVIYADQNPNELRRYAAKLEQFDLAARTLRTMENPAVAPSARLTIFVVRDQDEVQRIAGARGSALAGFYIARSSGSIAVVPEDTVGGGDSFNAETVFFHEYAHHLMFEQLDQAVPEWFSEGFAEFFSTARFERDGSILIGTAPPHRSYGIFSRQGISYSNLLSGNYSAKMDAEEAESLYGRGWLLAHYLTFASGRQGQLANYLSRLARGEPSATAATSAFGDLKQMEREIRRYVAQLRLSALRVKSDEAAIGKVEIRPLRPGEAAIMPTRIRSKVGVTSKTAPATLAKARQVAQQYPGEALVAVSLAEASLDANDIEGAIAAAARATELDRRSVEANIFRGRALLARANSGGSKAADIKAAREDFLAANKLEPEHPEPLRAFYESFFAARETPNRNAAAALHYAAVLAPADRTLRWMSAQQYLIDGEGAKARRDLSILAFDPHGGAAADHAKEVIVLIDGGKTDQALNLLQKDSDKEPALDSSQNRD